MQHGIEAVPFITPWGTAFMNVSDRRFGLPDSECCVRLSGVGGEYLTNELTGHIRYRQARPALTKRCLLIRRTRHPWLLCSVCVAQRSRLRLQSKGFARKWTSARVWQNKRVPKNPNRHQLYLNNTRFEDGLVLRKRRTDGMFIIQSRKKTARSLMFSSMDSNKFMININTYLKRNLLNLEWNIKSFYRMCDGSNTDKIHASSTDCSNSLSSDISTCLTFNALLDLIRL